MKLFVLSVCLMATAVVADMTTIKDAVLHGVLRQPNFTDDDLQECYLNANLIEADLITKEEIKDDSYKKSENTEKARKNGCFVACIAQKRGLLVDSEIQKEKLYAKKAHARLNKATQAMIYTTVDTCVEGVKEEPNLCDKSLSLLVCLWKPFI